MEDLLKKDGSQALDGTQPGANGKTFTQEEVNQIVSERLKRERTKAEPSEQEKRESELAARESKLNCREYLSEKGYPVELLDILDTSDAEAFKGNLDKLCSLLPGLTKTHSSGMRQGGSVTTFADELANAFKRK